MHSLTPHSEIILSSVRGCVHANRLQRQCSQNVSLYYLGKKSLKLAIVRKLSH